jgi:hypothetical protein
LQGKRDPGGGSRAGGAVTGLPCGHRLFPPGFAGKTVTFSCAMPENDRWYGRVRFVPKPACSSPGGKRQATAFLLNPLVTQGFRNHRKGERSEPRREDSAIALPQRRSPKPTTGRLWAAMHAAGFGFTIRGLRPDHTSGVFRHSGAGANAPALLMVNGLPATLSQSIGSSAPSPQRWGAGPVAPAGRQMIRLHRATTAGSRQ